MMRRWVPKAGHYGRLSAPKVFLIKCIASDHTTLGFVIMPLNLKDTGLSTTSFMPNLVVVDAKIN